MKCMKYFIMVGLMVGCGAQAQDNYRFKVADIVSGAWFKQCNPHVKRSGELAAPIFIAGMASMVKPAQGTLTNSRRSAVVACGVTGMLCLFPSILKGFQYTQGQPLESGELRDALGIIPTGIAWLYAARQIAAVQKTESKSNNVNSSHGPKKPTGLDNVSKSYSTPTSFLPPLNQTGTSVSSSGSTDSDDVILPSTDDAVRAEGQILFDKTDNTVELEYARLAQINFENNVVNAVDPQAVAEYSCRLEQRRLKRLAKSPRVARSLSTILEGSRSASPVAALRSEDKPRGEEAVVHADEVSLPVLLASQAPNATTFDRSSASIILIPTNIVENSDSGLNVTSNDLSQNQELQLPITAAPATASESSTASAALEMVTNATYSVAGALWRGLTNQQYLLALANAAVGAGQDRALGVTRRPNQDSPVLEQPHSSVSSQPASVVSVPRPSSPQSNVQRPVANAAAVVSASPTVESEEQQRKNALLERLKKEGKLVGYEQGKGQVLTHQQKNHKTT